MVTRGELALPELQRRYVWRASRVRDLFDSLYRGYPSGSILVWETDEEVPQHELAVSQVATPFKVHKLLLDGQQRITSLAAVLQGNPVKVRNRKTPINILFNLEHPEGPPTDVDVTEMEVEDEPATDEVEINGDDGEDSEDEAAAALQERMKRRAFIVSSSALEKDPVWVRVTDIFQKADRDLLMRVGIKGFDDPRYAKYTERLNRVRKIRDYPYVMNVLGRDLNYEEVAEIFVRVNSLGVKLRSSDLALAQITSRWRNSLKLFEEFQHEYEKIGFDLDLGTYLRALIVVATKQCKFQAAAGLSRPVLEESWRCAKDGLDFALNFLRTVSGVERVALLSSPFLIIPIAAYGHLRKGKLTTQDTRELNYWLHVANARGRYSRGSSETFLNEDLSILFRGDGPAKLLEPIKRVFGRLDVDESDFAGRGQSSTVFPAVFLALKALGARDWATGNGISMNLQGKAHAIEYHHIFPKALLRERGYDDKAEINEMANFAFISSRTNKEIGKQEPSVYFPKFEALRPEEIFAAHAIPSDPTLHKVENFRAFLKTRRSLLVVTVNAFLSRAREV